MGERSLCSILSARTFITGPPDLVASSPLISPRLRIRGIKSIVFYGLPHYPQFYTEMVNMLVGTDISCLVLYTRFEAFELERIVGEKRCDVMLRSPQNTHLIAAT